MQARNSYSAEDQGNTASKVVVNVRPYFSLVVPTIGRSQEVDALLESITQAQCQDLEVLIIDQNSDDRLLAICDKYKARLKLIHYKVNFKGAARARNYGAERALGKIVTFPDDDCELTRTLLAEAKELFERKALKLLVGVCTDRNGDATVTRFARGDCFLTVWNMWNRNAECTLFFCRETFMECGGFDEDFGVGSQYESDEGPELLLRMLAVINPHDAFYTDRLRYFHPEVARNFSAIGIERSFRYARGSGALLAKCPMPPVLLRSLSLLLRATVASILFQGNKGRYYRARISGFLAGFRTYRASVKPG